MSFGIEKKIDLKLEKIAELYQERMRKRKGKEKWAGFGEDVTREGIEIAKKLKSTGLHSKLRGNTMKDYMHHMDMSAHPKFMQGVKMKVGSLGIHALEAGGLGILAAPTIYKKVTGKDASKGKKDAAELAGLGTLAAHPAHELGKFVMGKIKKAGVSAALVKLSGDFDKATYMKDMARKPVPSGAPAAAAKPQFTMQHLQAARAQMGASPAMVRPRPPPVARANVPHMASRAAGAAEHNPGLLGKALSIFRKV